MYADYEYYKDTYKGNLEEQDAVKALQKASRHIDTLTYNRIEAMGFDALSEYQQWIVKECACLMADWETENKDYIESLLSSYSLNGASMSFTGNSANAVVVNGVAVSRDNYAHLQKSGFCCRVLRGC